MRPRWLLEASGIALFLSLPYFAQLLFPGNIALYHHHRQLTNILCGLLLAMVEIFAFALALIAYFHYRFRSKPRAVVGAAIATALALRGADNIISLTLQWNTGLNPEVGQAVSPPAIVAIATHFWYAWWFRLGCVGAVVALALWKPSVTRPVVRLTRTALAGFAFCLLWIVPQILYLAFGLKSSSPTHPRMHPANNKQIVWILFDELSYKLAFDQPPPGMTFPNFDRLHSESVSFSNIQASGFYTDRIVPSVIVGKKIDEIRSGNDRKLLYMDTETHHWLPYDPNQTLFGLAQATGWNSGVVGWYNPYCRIFASVVDSCLWEPSAVLSLPLESVGASEQKPVLANASLLARTFLTARTPTEAEIAAPRIRIFNNLMTRARDLIREDQIDFVFIHLSVPHPPGFYDRRTGKLCPCGNYLDNLALADQALGQLESEINHSAQGPQTTLIVSSDHSWRVPMWRGNEYWTAEEERISQGQFDPRPVFLVHFPGQQSVINITTLQPELIEHDIIAAMLQNKLQSPDDLTSFLLPTPKEANVNRPGPTDH